MRVVLGCVAILALSFSVSAADEKIDGKKLIGKWAPAEAKKGPNITLEFADKGKMTLSVEFMGKDEKAEGSYTLKDNKLDVTLKFMGQEIKETMTIKKLTDDELTTEDSKGKSETMKRVKEAKPKDEKKK